MCFIYRLMVAAVPLLEFAISRAEGNVLKYYKKHISEELGHEVMLLSDINGLGVTAIPQYLSAARLAGSQYYMIAHHHPALLLGYMQALESKPVPLSFVDELERHHKCKLTCLRHHSIHDSKHIADLDILVASLPGDILEQVAWNRNAVDTALRNQIQVWRQDNG